MGVTDDKHDVEAAARDPVVADSDIRKGPAGVVEGVARVVDHVAERKLCWKFDIRLMPVLAIMCKPCSSRIPS